MPRVAMRTRRYSNVTTRTGFTIHASDSHGRPMCRFYIHNMLFTDSPVNCLKCRSITAKCDHCGRIGPELTFVDYPARWVQTPWGPLRTRAITICLVRSRCRRRTNPRGAADEP